MSSRATDANIAGASMHDIGIDAANADEMDVVRELFLEYADWLQIDLCFQGFERELATLPGKYAPPGGGVWIARVGGEVAGVVALRPCAAPGCAELKRLWVRAAYRGHGLGRRLTLVARDAATRAGYRALRLDTLASMVHARALYRSVGFEPIAPYYDNPHADVAFLELKLAAG